MREAARANKTPTPQTSGPREVDPKPRQTANLETVTCALPSGLRHAPAARQCDLEYRESAKLYASGGGTQSDENPLKTFRAQCVVMNKL